MEVGKTLLFKHCYCYCSVALKTITLVYFPLTNFTEICTLYTVYSILNAHLYCSCPLPNTCYMCSFLLCSHSRFPHLHMGTSDHTFPHNIQLGKLQNVPPITEGLQNLPSIV